MESWPAAFTFGIFGAMPEQLGKCVVCGHADARALCTTRLSRGDIVVVCGTHELMYRRAERKAETASELRSMLRDRRETRRRRPIPDELGARLIEAFSVSSNRRAVGERRR
jgi:urease accessory protein UreF